MPKEYIFRSIYDHPRRGYSRTRENAKWYLHTVNPPTTQTIRRNVPIYYRSTHNKGWWQDSGRYSFSGAAPTAPTHFRIPHIPLVPVHSSSGQPPRRRAANQKMGEQPPLNVGLPLQYLTG
jgi:hypothetical protein